MGVRELGGDVMFLSAADIQLGRGEPIQDTARVLGRMVHGAIIRTFAQSDVVEFARCSGLPTINALTDDEHPCQILADLLTIEEKLGSLEGKRVVFIGDGACNVAHSWIWAAVRMGFDLAHCRAAGLSTGRRELLARPARLPSKFSRTMPEAAERGGRALHGRMGQHGERRRDGVSPGATGQVPDQRCSRGARQARRTGDALSPGVSGQGDHAQSFEAHAETIFDQAENRLHAQKAVLSLMAR